MKKRWLLHGIATAGLLVASCRCGGSEHAAPTSPETGTELTAWSSRFELPASWSGGTNDAGGYEYTDGELALMVGRAPTAAAPNLDAFFDARVAVLAEQGKLSKTERSSSAIAGKPARSLNAVISPERGAPLSVRLLVVEPNESERLSLLMIGEDRHASKLAQNWRFLLASLRFR
jgi:hypothetical protein